MSTNTPAQPPVPIKRAVSFIDGQNLFYAAEEAFGYDYPNYHPVLLTERICDEYGWRFHEARLYTGVPKKTDNLYWHNFWAAKKRFLSRDKRMYVFTRDTHYRKKRISFEEDTSRIILSDGFPLPKGTQLLLPNGKTAPGEVWVRTGEEKGIDVRIALDMIRLIYRNEFDVGIIFSQDQDLSEAVSEVREIARDQKRHVEMLCAFPCSSKTTNRHPIRGTTPFEINQEFYDTCLDKNNYSRRR